GPFFEQRIWEPFDTFPDGALFDALARSTNLPFDKVEMWFAARLRGITVDFWTDSTYQTEESHLTRTSLASVASVVFLDEDWSVPEELLQKAADRMRNRPPRCFKLNDDDPGRQDRLKRDGKKQYQCTRGCGYKCASMRELMRHDERNYPQK